MSLKAEAGTQLYRRADATPLAGTFEESAGGPIVIGGRTLPTRFFLAPLAGYTHLAFRMVLRGIGGLGLATTDLVLASMLWSERRKSLD